MYRKPSGEDLSKLNSEINLYINQRLVITTTAITVFGVLAGLVAPTTSESGGTELRPLSLLLPPVLMIILSIMLWYCQSVLEQIHVISTYLVETGSSIWEAQYRSFTKKLNLMSSLENMPLFVFAALGGFSMALSTAIYFVAYSAGAKDQEYLLRVYISLGLFVSVSIIYWVVFIYFWFHRNPKRFRENASQSWRDVLTQKARENVSSNHVCHKLFDDALTNVWDNSEDDIYNDI